MRRVPTRRPIRCRSLASTWVAWLGINAWQLAAPSAPPALLPSAWAAPATASRPANPAANPPATSPPSPTASQPEKIGETTLLAESDPLTSAVAVTAFLRAPSPPPPAGLRYLLERLILDPNHPAGAAAMALRARGWRVQAFTTPDYTAYQVVGDRQVIDDALRFLRAVLSEPPLPTGAAAEALLTQHRQSIALLQSSAPSSAVPLSRLFGLAYGDHPGARPIVGTTEQIASLQAPALREHWAQFYRPAALTLVLSGGLDASRVTGVRQQLHDLEAHVVRLRGRASPTSIAGLSGTRPPGKLTAGPHHGGPQLRLLPISELPVSQPGLWLGFALDGATPAELAALEVAAQLPLPGGREISLLLGPSQSPGLFVLRGPAPEAAERLLTNVEAALQLAPTVSEEAVGKARRRLLLDVARRSETPAGRALRLIALALTGSDETAWQRRIAGLTPGDVQRTLSRFLQPDRLSILLRAPSRGTETPAQVEGRLRERLLAGLVRPPSAPSLPSRPATGTAPTSEPRGRAQILRGESGAHLVLLPTPAASGSAASARQGLVAFTALWPGGRKREEARLRGLHDLLVRVWPHATASLPGAALSSLLAELNFVLQAEASDDALALRGQLPSEGLPQALALLRDCLESPRISEAEVERARRDVVLASRRSLPGGDAASARAGRPVRGASTVEFDAARYAEQLLAQALKRQTASPASHGESSPANRSPRYEELAPSVAVLSPRHLQDLLRGYDRSPPVLAIVGDFEPNSVIGQLSPWLGKLKPLSDLPRTLLPVSPAEASLPASSTDGAATTPSSHSPDAAPPQLFGFAATAQAHLLLGARVPGCAPADRGTPLSLELLLELLASEAGTGTAQQALLNRRALAFSVEGTLSGCLPERSLSLYVATSPRSLDAAEAALRDEIRRLVDHPVAPETLALARERLVSRWVLSGQRRGDRALQLARALLFGLPDPALSGDSPAELLRHIDASALQALAKQYLSDGQLVRAAVLPESQRLALSAHGVTLHRVEPAPAVDVSPVKPMKQSVKQSVKQSMKQGSGPSGRPEPRQAGGPSPAKTGGATAQQRSKQAKQSPEKTRAAAASARPHAAEPDSDRGRRAKATSKHAAKLPQRL